PARSEVRCSTSRGALMSHPRAKIAACLETGGRTNSRNRSGLACSLEPRPARVRTSGSPNCPFRLRQQEATVRNPSDDEIYFDSNGSLTERRRFGGQEVIVHYDDVPPSDITTVDGIPCTTALRTVIDIAPDLDRAQLRR